MDSRSNCRRQLLVSEKKTRRTSCAFSTFVLSDYLLNVKWRTLSVVASFVALPNRSRQLRLEKLALARSPWQPINRWHGYGKRARRKDERKKKRRNGKKNVGKLCDLRGFVICTHHHRHQPQKEQLSYQFSFLGIHVAAGQEVQRVLLLPPSTPPGGPPFVSSLGVPNGSLNQRQLLISFFKKKHLM